MSLFICDICGCVDNTNCNNPPYDMTRIDPAYPNLHSMEAAGFDKEYKNTGIRSPRKLLCSKCNTGSWHGEFPMVKATAIEILMGSQLEGDEFNIFTFHPLWNEYNKDPDNFDIDKCKHYQVQKYSQRETAPNKLYIREEPKIGRNETCPCGSGKKSTKSVVLI